MSEFAPPDEPGDLAGTRQEALTPQAIDALLADFRAWLEQAAAAPREETGAPAPSSFVLDAAEEPLDLHTLLGQFVALRHEVNLQTKASRTQQEQTTEALGRLGEALEVLEEERAAPAPAAAPADEHARPLLKTLVDLHDNLSLARREVQRVNEALQPFLDPLAVEEAGAGREPLEDSALCTQNSVPSSPPATASSRRSLWARWFGAGLAESAPPRDLLDEVAALREQVAAQRKQLQALRERQSQAGLAAQRTRQFVTSLITGYTMSLQRVERALQQHGLEAIPTVGEPFDPEVMEVLEVLHEPGRTTTEVVEEVRRGYVWRGHVFRCAQVRVARAQAN